MEKLTLVVPSQFGKATVEIAQMSLLTNKKYLLV